MTVQNSTFFQFFIDTASVGLSHFVCMASNNIEQAQTLLEGAGDSRADAVANLNARRLESKREQQTVAKEIHNQQRKRARLLGKAKGFTDSQLLAVVSIRAAAKAKVKAKSNANSGMRSLRCLRFNVSFGRRRNLVHCACRRVVCFLSGHSQCNAYAAWSFMSRW